MRKASQTLVYVPNSFCTNSMFIWPYIVINSFSIKPTDALISKFILVTQLYMFRAVSLPIVRSYLLCNRHWYTLCRFWWPLEDPARKRSSNLHKMHQCRLYSKITHDDGQGSCPKYVELCYQNKFGSKCICWFYWKGVFVRCVPCERDFIDAPKLFVICFPGVTTHCGCIFTAR